MVTNLGAIQGGLGSHPVTNTQIERFNKKLEKLAGQIRHPIEANRQASISLYGWVLTNFDREGESVGGWVPLRPRTIREKAKLGKEKMLVRTGHLRAGFVPGYSDENAWVRNEVQYAATHHLGSEKKNIPARPLLPDRKTVLTIGLQVYGRYVAKQVEDMR